MIDIILKAIMILGIAFLMIYGIGIIYYNLSEIQKIKREEYGRGRTKRNK